VDASSVAADRTAGPKAGPTASVTATGETSRKSRPLRAAWCPRLGRTLLARRKSLVAIEQGTWSYRAVQLIRSPAGLRLGHWMLIERKMSAGGQDPSAEAAAQTALAAGLRQFDGRRIGVVVGTGADYCLLQAPPAIWSQPSGQILEALRWEVGRQLSWPVEEAELGAWPLATPMSGGNNTMAVAARRADLVAMIETLEQQGFRCEWAEPAATALVRACAASAGCRDGEIWGILELGASASHIHLVVDSSVVYARAVRGSGRSWTQAIASELHIEPLLAEQYKRRFGIGRAGRGCRTLMGGLELPGEEALPGVIMSVLKPALTDLLCDVERAYRFVMEQYPRHTAAALVLVGGGSRLPNLTQWFAKSLGIRVVQASAEGTLSVDATHPLASPGTYSVLAGAIGLALGDLA